MAITVALASDLYPLFRIQVMRQGNWGHQQWRTLPASGRLDKFGNRYYGEENGYDITDADVIERKCLPDVGRATFRFEYGEINGNTYGVSASNTTTTDIDTAIASHNALDLVGFDVRIQVAKATDSASAGYSPAWKTTFLGTCIAQHDTPFTGSDAAGGTRIYECADLMWRTQQWPMDRHSTYINGVQCLHARGHPGYNSAVQGYFRRIIGNKDPAGTTVDPFGDLGSHKASYICHCWTAGGNTGFAAATWSDAEVVNHALVSSRASGEPILYVAAGDVGSYGLEVLSNSHFSWPVQAGESCWSFINRVLDRKRARGMAFLDWTTDTPDGDITPFISITPQFLSDVSITDPLGGTITYHGANTAATSVSVNLDGDMRAAQVEVSKNVTAKIDYLESQGEPIEVLATLSYVDGSLEKRWASADETAFLALPANKPWQRLAPRWDAVWQRWGIPTDWNWSVGDGNGGTTSYINYYCDDAGAIQQGGSGAQTSSTTSDSHLIARIMSDLPIYEGYDYTSDSHTRWDGAKDIAPPPRMAPLILANLGGDFYNAAASYGAGLRNDDWGILVSTGNDLQNGTRLFSGHANIGGAFGPDAFAVTVGLQLGVPVRMASHNNDPDGNAYTYLTACRRKVLKYEGLCLWLADYQAIWAIDWTTATNPAMPALREACGAYAGSPGILRDDRSSLAQLHALAWAWYGIDHGTGQWSLNACGFVPPVNDPAYQPGWVDASGSYVYYPRIGQLVTTLVTSGSQTITLNAPITAVRYANGVTTWVADWNDLDLS